MAHVEDEVGEPLFEFEEERLNGKSSYPGFFEASQQHAAQEQAEDAREQQDAKLEEVISASQTTTGSPQLIPKAGSSPKSISSPKKTTHDDQAYTFVREPRPVPRSKGLG